MNENHFTSYEDRRKLIKYIDSHSTLYEFWNIYMALQKLYKDIMQAPYYAMDNNYGLSPFDNLP